MELDGIKKPRILQDDEEDMVVRFEATVILHRSQCSPEQWEELMSACSLAALESLREAAKHLLSKDPLEDFLERSAN